MKLKVDRLKQQSIHLVAENADDRRFLNEFKYKSYYTSAVTSGPFDDIITISVTNKMDTISKDDIAEKERVAFNRGLIWATEYMVNKRKPDES